LKALLITPYYNCVTECVLLYYKEKIDALVFMEVDTITVSKMVEKYHLTNILCFSYEEYMLRNDTFIIDIDFLDFNVSFSYHLQTNKIKNNINTSVYKNKKYKKNISKTLQRKIKNNYLLINLQERKESYKKFKHIIYNLNDDLYYYFYKNDVKINTSSNQYCYQMSWNQYFFNTYIVYTNETILLNILYAILSNNIQKYIKEKIQVMLCQENL
jgi:hypothetical protein